MITGPKNGKGRYVAMSPGLGSLLLDLLGSRRVQAMQQGRPEPAEWAFPGETLGSPST